MPPINPSDIKDCATPRTALVASIRETMVYRRLCDLPDELQWFATEGLELSSVYRRVLPELVGLK